MAVPLFRAKTMFPEASGTTMKFTIPATTATGDTVIVAIQLGKKKVVAAPSADWKEPATQVIPAIEEWTVAIFYLPNWSEAKYGKEFTFTWDGTNIPRNGYISTWSGCDENKPISVVSNAAIKESPKATKAIIDAYTTTTKENRPLQFLWNNEGRTAAPPANYTEFADQTGGPAGNYKTAGVEPGEVPKNEITVAEQVTMTLGLALQPQQEVTTHKIKATMEMKAEMVAKMILTRTLKPVMTITSSWTASMLRTRVIKAAQELVMSWPVKTLITKTLKASLDIDAQLTAKLVRTRTVKSVLTMTNTISVKTHSEHVFAPGTYLKTGPGENDWTLIMGV